MIISETEVVELLERELDLDPGDVQGSSSSDDVEYWDSLGHLRVCMAIEAAFNVKIPMDAVPKLGSVPAILAFLAAAPSK